MVIAVIAAVATGGSFAAGAVLQQRAASTRPESEALALSLLLHLVRQPQWMLGIGFAVLSYILEAVALAFGPLVLVQPLIVSELLFALPISIAWRGMHMARREWAGVCAVTAGLALGLVSAAPSQGRPEAPLTEWAVSLGVLTLLTAVSVVIGRFAGGMWRAILYAAGAGLVLGAQASMLKATVARFEGGLVTGLASWELWGMIAAALLGLLLIQSAYQAGPLATSMPVVDAVDPAVAIVFGIVLFHEHIRTGLWLAGILLGVLLLVWGIALVDRSPLIQALRKAERQEQIQSSQAGVLPQSEKGEPSR